MKSTQRGDTVLPNQIEPENTLGIFDLKKRRLERCYKCTVS